MAEQPAEVAAYVVGLDQFDVGREVVGLFREDGLEAIGSVIVEALIKVDAAQGEACQQVVRLDTECVATGIAGSRPLALLQVCEPNFRVTKGGLWLCLQELTEVVDGTGGSGPGSSAR